VNRKYSTHFNPANRRELRIAVVSKREFGGEAEVNGGENIQPNNKKPGA